MLLKSNHSDTLESPETRGHAIYSTRFCSYATYTKYILRVLSKKYNFSMLLIITEHIYISTAFCFNLVMN